ncbi:phage tail protein [Pseudomonas putida]|uniref:phage tail protein n=1 Tax=Pseudomonas putida TaxID=303 RepID=UPI0021B12A63|nr:phage tail protein [Pseudomonas putida]
MWARIENGAVAEITDIDPTGRFHPALKWRVCGEDVAPGWSYDGQTYEAPVRAQPRADILCARIDDAADAARARVAGDPLRAVEYDRARIEAQAFADAGYPGDAVPRTVAAWAINGRTAQQAADSILAEAAAYTEALYVIRETRLAAKEHIRMLMDAGEVEQAQQLAEQTIAVIEAAVAGVGNNPAA